MFFHVSLIVCDSVSEQFWISSFTDAAYQVFFLSIQTCYHLLYKKSQIIPKKCLGIIHVHFALFWFTSERKTALPTLGSKWNFIAFHHWLCCFPRTRHDPYLLIYFSDSGNQCYIWIPDCLFLFPVVRGREMYLQTVHCYMKARDWKSDETERQWTKVTITI